MQDRQNDELSAMRAEAARLIERWAEAKAAMLAAGDAVLAVPRAALERIAAVCAPPVDRITHPIIRA